MEYTITFMATGGITIEADSEEEASNKFEDKMDEAFAELKQNGITITGIYCPGKNEEGET